MLGYSLLLKSRISWLFKRSLSTGYKNVYILVQQDLTKSLGQPLILSFNLDESTNGHPQLQFHEQKI